MLDSHSVVESMSVRVEIGCGVRKISRVRVFSERIFALRLAHSRATDRGVFRHIGETKIVKRDMRNGKTKTEQIV